MYITEEKIINSLELLVLNNLQPDWIVKIEVNDKIIFEDDHS